MKKVYLTFIGLVMLGALGACGMMTDEASRNTASAGGTTATVTSASPAPAGP